MERMAFSAVETMQGLVSESVPSKSNSTKGLSAKFTGAP